MEWEFTSRDYSDFSNTLPPLAYGTLFTDADPDGDGRHQILSATGFYGADQIVGLSNRVLWALQSYAKTPDQFVSTNADDTQMGCTSAMGSAYGVVPHFTCDGIALSTTNGSINLFFGGATPFLAGYSEELIMARHVITPKSIPTPPAALVIVSILSLRVFLIFRRRTIELLPLRTFCMK
jgi:hypothetical protein